MPVHTITQKTSLAAYDQIAARRPGKEYKSFAREFPTLVHTCGLAQAVAFALAKRGHQQQYLEDLAAVLSAAGHADVGRAERLAERTRSAVMTQYLRLSRDALAAAVWLKRYVEALGED